HIAALPLMLDAVSSLRQGPVLIHALPETIAALRTHVFNNIIWPNFECIPSADHPFIRYRQLETGELRVVAGLTVEALPAIHTVAAVGYAIQGRTGWWAFSGDTERNPAFWKRVNQLPLAVLVIETAFSDRERALALRSLHLSPQALLAELALCELRDCPVYITHTKPAETEVIFQEILLGLAMQPATTRRRRGPLDIRWLKAGQEFSI
ncbi:MAG: 3',5'-cyclic-nucleotide phosphodiesterase, partial [Alcaligenaceae bacterium]